MNRKEILTELIRVRFNGNQADFARAIKRASAQVNQWMTGHRNLGDAGARHIEIALELPKGFFDGKAGQAEMTALCAGDELVAPPERHDKLTRQVIDLMQPLSQAEKAIVLGGVIGIISGFASNNKSQKKASA